MKEKIEFDYDKENDILMVCTKKGKYKVSQEFGDVFVVDFDDKGRVKGLEIFDFSELVKLVKK